MKLKSRRNHIQPNVDMTPMIDVVFQLILFFLVSTTFAVLPGIKLNLPQSTTSENTTMQGITITAEKDGSIYFNQNKVSEEELAHSLIEYDCGSTIRKDFPISLEADSEVTNGTIVHLFDIIRQSGFSIINLRTADD